MLAVRLTAIFLSFWLNLGFLAAQEDYHLRSQNDPASGNRPSEAENAFRILYIGNSITRHAPSESLHWHHTAGMAASAEANDYAHRLARKIQKALPDRKVEIFFHTYGGSGSAAHRLSAIRQVLPLEPHLVIVQLGEHEREADGTEQLRRNYSRLITAFDDQEDPPLVLCTGTWGSRRSATHPTEYDGWAGEIDRVQRAVAEEEGKVFVSLVEIATDMSNRNWGEHPGVRWHPNDDGHAGYARLLFEAFQQNWKR
jgi:hypothetical protein